MSRILWRGTISLGLLNIPVELHTAVQEQPVRFKMLHIECKTPIHNKRWCQTCNKEIAWSDTTRGLALKNGKFLIMSPKALVKMKPEKSDLIEIKKFVMHQGVPSIYGNEHYYLIPDRKAHHKPFSLFVSALTETQTVALASFIFRDKEHVCVLSPYRNGILLTTLHYANEIRPLPAIKSDKSSPAELELAKELVTSRISDSFDISEFKNRFVEKLKTAVARRKIEKPPVKPHLKEKEPSSLMDILKASIHTRSHIPARVRHTRK